MQELKSSMAVVFLQRVEPWLQSFHLLAQLFWRCMLAQRCPLSDAQGLESHTAQFAGHAKAWLAIEATAATKMVWDFILE